MYYKLLSIMVFLLYNSVYSQSNNIFVEQVYSKLAHKQIDYFQFSDLYPLIEGYQTEGKENSHFILLDISKPIDLKIKKFTDNNPASAFYFRDSIFLLQKKYCIDNLFYNKKALTTQDPLRLNYASGYSFSLNSKKYIALFFWDSSIPTSNLSYYIILFDISNHENIKHYFFNEQMSFNPNCFGDFNNDGKIDFINWSYYNNIHCYTLDKNKFKKIRNKMVVIKETSNNVFSINWKKSKWFKID